MVLTGDGGTEPCVAGDGTAVPFGRKPGFVLLSM